MIYAIGDIHGHLDKLCDLHARIEADAAGRAHRVIHIGDLIDRGPDSKGVIEYMMKGQADGKNWDVIKGNHDGFLVQFAHNGELFDRGAPKLMSWVDPIRGGAETLRSFDIDPECDLTNTHLCIPKKMVDWLDQLPSHIHIGRLYFAHAGVNPERDLNDQIDNDLLWIRDPFLNCDQPFAALIIHGHTPTDKIEHSGNRINLDTGAGYGREMSVIVIEGNAIYHLTAKGRVQLKPPPNWSILGEKIC